MRTAIVLIFTVLYLLIMLPMQLITFITQRLVPPAGDRLARALAGFGFMVVEKLSGSRITVIGAERIPVGEPVLYIGNHRSFFDIIYMFNRSAGPMAFLSKIEVKKVPILNWWMMLLKCEFLDRKDIKQGLQTILRCIDNVKAGYSMMIFPEGTRNREEGTIMEFHEGSFKVATKTGCPIVPVVINHTGQVLEDHFPWIRKANVTIEFAEPIYPEKLDPEDKKHIGEYTRQKMLKILEKNQ